MVKTLNMRSSPLTRFSVQYIIAKYCTTDLWNLLILRNWNFTLIAQQFPICPSAQPLYSLLPWVGLFEIPNHAVFVFLACYRKTWHVTLSVMFLRLRHVVADCRISFSFKCWKIFHVMCILHFLYPSVNECSGCFQLSAIMNYVPKNMGVLISLWDPDFNYFG